jgi:hypothetical protein
VPQGGFRILGLDWVIVHVNDLHWLEGLLLWVLIVFVGVRLVNRRHVVDVIVGIMRWLLLAFGSGEMDAPLLSRWADGVIVDVRVGLLVFVPRPLPAGLSARLCVLQLCVRLLLLRQLPLGGWVGQLYVLTRKTLGQTTNTILICMRCCSASRA